MLYAGLHCNGFSVHTQVQWVRKHSRDTAPVTEDYFRIRLEMDKGEVIIFMDPSQLDALATALAQASQDRAVVLAEENPPVFPVTTGPNLA